MIRLAAPDIDPSDLAALQSVLASGWLSGGPAIARFEADVCAATGAQHAVAVANGTAALVLALQALGIGRGDEVLVPSFTYIATAHAVVLAGAEPRLVDVDRASWNMDPASAAAACGPRTRALIPVDQFGLPADLESLQEACPSLPIIEDAACALGARRGQDLCGADVELACLSFHPRKIITTGEGGMILTRSAEHAATLRQLRNHGRDDAGRFCRAAHNLRLSALAAALGSSQLQRLGSLLTRRRDLAAHYQRRLGQRSDIALQEPAAGHAYQTFALALHGAPNAARRDRLLEALRARGIEAGIATTAAHCELPYRDAPETSPVPLPTSTWLAKNGFALPLHPALSMKDVDLVCDALQAVLDALPATESTV